MLGLVCRSFATKIAAGVTKNTKDSAGKRLYLVDKLYTVNKIFQIVQALMHSLTIYGY